MRSLRVNRCSLGERVRADKKDQLDRLTISGSSEVSARSWTVANASRSWSFVRRANNRHCQCARMLNRRESIHLSRRRVSQRKGCWPRGLTCREYRVDQRKRSVLRDSFWTIPYYRSDRRVQRSTRTDLESMKAKRRSRIAHRWYSSTREAVSLDHNREQREWQDRSWNCSSVEGAKKEIKDVCSVRGTSETCRHRETLYLQDFEEFLEINLSLPLRVLLQYSRSNPIRKRQYRPHRLLSLANDSHQ